MADRSAPVTTPDPGYELCYECEGKRLCWSCHGEGRRRSGDVCNTCAGRGLCLVCNGDGQLPAGTEASVDGRQQTGHRLAKRIGCFRELGYEGAQSLEQARGEHPSVNQDRTVAYLRAGKVLIMSPGLVRDPFDRSAAAGSRSMLTDGAYAWPDSLAYFVQRYNVALPAEFEQHMAANDWKVPADVDTKGLEIK
jgi:hypothetical protein